VGRLLNLGAGNRGALVDRSFVVNVDHVEPADCGSSIFVVADGAALPFRSGSFVGIIAKDVLEHLPNPVSVLAEIRRTALDDATLLVTVPRAIARAVWDDPTHVRGFTQNALQTALRLSGWRPDQPIRRIGSIPGAGRLGLAAHLETLLRIPIFGHWFGTNWMVFTRPTV
jgi:SAM-dependent methyltransferase